MLFVFNFALLVPYAQFVKFQTETALSIISLACCGLFVTFKAISHFPLFNLSSKIKINNSTQHHLQLSYIFCVHGYPTGNKTLTTLHTLLPQNRAQMLRHVRVLGFRFCLLRFVPFQPFNEYRFILFHLQFIPRRLPRSR